MNEASAFSSTRESDHGYVAITRGSNLLRIILGLIWIAGAVFNAAWTLRHTSTFRDNLGSESTFAPYRWFFDDIVGSAPVFWTILLILGETVLGLLLLGKQARVRLGLVLSVAWSTFLTFMIWPYTLTTIPLVIVSGVLLRHEHPASFSRPHEELVGPAPPVVGARS